MASYEYDSQNEQLNRIAGGTLYADCPIGSYIPFGGTAIPTGWLLCNGQAVSRTDYADLFAVIGTAYGSGDGSTTFNIPDLREAVPKGAGLTSKSNNHMDADGLALGEFIDDRMQNHKHNVTIPTGNESGYQLSYGNENELSTVYGGGVSDARIGATTEVKSVGSNYIIKAKQIGVPADFASAIEDVIDENIINLSDSFNVTLTPNGYATQDVTFSQQLPNANYVVSFDTNSIGSILFTVMQKSTTTMTLNIRNLNDANLPVTCGWSLICKR